VKLKLELAGAPLLSIPFPRAYASASADARRPSDIDALNAVMRIKTDSNALVIEGTLDTPENKNVWRTIGAEALPLAIAARKEMPKSVRALAVYADAYMFTCSAKGIVKQAVTGAGKEYKRFAKELCAHPSWDSAVGLVFLGGFYNVAPWPAGNKKKAKEYMREAARLYPTKRNLYYVGVNAYQTAEYEVAADHFGRALDAACGSATEEDFKDFLSERSAQGLELAKEAMAAKAGGGAK